MNSSQNSQRTPVTLHDIAQSLGISQTAVALALRDSPRISRARRIEIHQAAQRMGYRPNAMAAALGHQRHSASSPIIHSAIAWLNCWSNPEQLRGFGEFDLYWKGAQQAAEQHGYHLEEFACQSRTSWSQLEIILQARNIQGILIPPQPWNHKLPGKGEFPWEKFCVVRFGYSVTDPATHVVTSNQVSTGMMTFESIRQRGYKRIGFVSGHVPSTRFRAGFLMKQGELSPKEIIPILYLKPRERRAGWQSGLKRWLKRYRPEALVTDVAELKITLEKMRYRIPQDIGLATTSILDGNADAGIYQNSEEIGKAAIETLISLIKHNYYGIPKLYREVLIEGSWVDGKSLPPRLMSNRLGPVDCHL
jgi:LacI family transcriptional regulator